MIGSGDYHNITRQLIELHQEKRHYALDFTGLVNIAALFPDSIELIEEQYARSGADILEQASEARIGLAKISPDKSVIAHCEQWDRGRLRDCFR